MITLHPPADSAPFKRITLHSSGVTYFPKGGCVKVAELSEADELLAEGWRMDAESAKASRFNADMLRKAATSQMRRAPGAGGDFEQDRQRNDMQLAEFTVRIGPERVRVKRGEKAIVIAGIEIPLGELAPQVQRQFSIATGRLDGASFDLDSDLVNMTEARSAIEAAIVAVMADRAFRDRLVISGTRRVGAVAQ